MPAPMQMNLQCLFIYCTHYSSHYTINREPLCIDSATVVYLHNINSKASQRASYCPASNYTVRHLYWTFTALAFSLVQKGRRKKKELPAMQIEHYSLNLILEMHNKYINKQITLSLYWYYSIHISPWLLIHPFQCLVFQQSFELLQTIHIKSA